MVALVQSWWKLAKEFLSYPHYLIILECTYTVFQKRKNNWWTADNCPENFGLNITSKIHMNCSWRNENYVNSYKRTLHENFMCISFYINIYILFAPKTTTLSMLSANQVRSRDDHIRMTINYVEIIVFKLIVRKHPPSEYDNVRKIR